ncbi:hypothetical protein N9Y92_04750, partial [Chlamydiales bacterium]|nr:hypothetical protein [Chlamydiales bacterium]
QATLGIDSTPIYQMLKNNRFYAFREPGFSDWSTEYWVIGEGDHLNDLSSNQKNRKISLMDANYGTHMVPLMTVVLNTKGPVLEMGCGDYSTPLLHSLCSVEKRLLLSTETDLKWMNLYVDLENSWHHFQYVPCYEDDWEVNPKPRLWDHVGKKMHWGVVFVDHRPGERRIEDVTRLRNQADVIVVHDTEQSTYRYEPVLSTFKYRYVYERYATQTTIVSDTIDVSLFFN